MIKSRKNKTYTKSKYMCVCAGVCVLAFHWPWPARMEVGGKGHRRRTGSVPKIQKFSKNKSMENGLTLSLSLCV